jgi:hypothetical protein
MNPRKSRELYARVKCNRIIRAAEQADAAAEELFRIESDKRKAERRLGRQALNEKK